MPNFFMQQRRYTIVIQGAKLKDYEELNHNERTFEKIEEYGWVLSDEMIERTIEGEKFKPEKKIS